MIIIVDIGNMIKIWVCNVFVYDLDEFEQCNLIDFDVVSFG